MPKGAVPFPFGDCRVCHAVATGNHYGANTCEGCKGFFKRSLGKSDKYKCLNNEKCAIDPDNRIKCKHCRFKKCLDLGMSMNAIKMGRIPKVQKQKALDGEKARCEQDKPIPNDINTLYRNTDLQASPPADELIEPPLPKQPKTGQGRSEGSHHALACQGTYYPNGHAQPMMTDNCQPHIPGSLYSCQSKPSYQMTQEMVQLISDVISIDDFKESYDRLPQQTMTSRHLNSTDYARSLASAAHSLSSTSHYNGWQHTTPAAQADDGKQRENRYQLPGHGYPYQSNSFGQYDLGPAVNSQYAGHAMDAYKQREEPPTSHAPLHSPTLERSASYGNGDLSPNAEPYYGDVPLGGKQDVSPVYTNGQFHEHSPGFRQEVHSDYGSVEEVSSVSSPFSLDSEEKIESIVKAITNIYVEVTDETRDGVVIMEEIIASGSTDRFIPYHPDNLKQLWTLLMESVAYYNDRMTQFCMQCPLISTLCPEDKAALIQHAYISVWLIWNAPLFKNGQSYIPFRDRHVYNRQWMENILPKEFVEYLHQYAARQNSARFGVREISLLCCLALTPVNVTNVKYPEQVRQVHQTCMRLLTQEICRNRVNPSDMLKEIPELLKHLETAVHKQHIILSFNEQKPPEVEF